MQADQLKVLVVEDDDFQRQMVMKVLASLGVASVVEAANGKEALHVLHQIRNEKLQEVDVVLCDMHMPEMDGMEFLRHLGEENHNVSIIVTSALNSRVLASVENMIRIYGIKLLGTIEKPLMPELLQLLLSRYKRTETVASGHKEKVFSLDEILQGIRDRQFVPFFQPKVDLRSGRITGAEVLARWIHPAYGLVSPFFFIPQLEKSGQIDELTFLMIEQAVKQCCLFHEHGHALAIAINLSAVSLKDPDLADKITSLVREAGLDPKYIVFEITESAALSDVARVLENLARLCMNGFALSIDDYGTGYSSMQQLTRIAFSELKIDQSFIKNFTNNSELRVIVESSIDMAHKLKMKSVAEGIETQQDLDTLSGISCDTGQGYFIAKPMDAGKFLEFIKKYKHQVAT